MPGIRTFTAPPQSKTEHIENLRRLKHLTVIEVDLEEEKDREPPQGCWDKARKIWKKELVSLLRDSPSTDRKFLRWKLVQSYPRIRGGGRAYDVVENGELEVLPETSP